MIHYLIFSGATLIYCAIVSLGPVFLIWFAFICLLTTILPDKTKRMGWKPRCLALASAIVAIGLVILIEPESAKLLANDQRREARTAQEEQVDAQ